MSNSSNPVDLYLDRLREATPEDHPFLLRDDAEALGAVFIPLAQATVGFVQYLRDTAGPEGYTEARSLLETLVHTFPVADEDDPAIALLRELFGE